MFGCGCTSSKALNDVDASRSQWSVEPQLAWLPSGIEDSAQPCGSNRRREIKVVKFDRLFEPELFARLEKDVRSIGWQYGWRSNTAMGYGHWNFDFCRVFKENGEDVSSKLSGSLLEGWEFLRENHYPGHILLRCYTNAHTFGVEGYPHTDSLRQCDITVVVYINSVWKREWGGETLIYGDGDNSIIHAELPKQNAAVEFPGCAWHVARGVTRICPELRVTLVFKLAPVGVDPLRDAIQRLLVSLGCDKTKHSGGLLIGHLIRSYDLLKEVAGCEPELCAAAGLHSVFGTSAFQHCALPRTESSRVALVAGPVATELILLFGQIASPRPVELDRALGACSSAGNSTRPRGQEQSRGRRDQGDQGEQGEGESITLKSDVHVTADSGLTTATAKTLSVSREQLRGLCLIECANLVDQNALSPSTLPNLDRLWRSKCTNSNSSNSNSNGNSNSSNSNSNSNSNNNSNSNGNSNSSNSNSNSNSNSSNSSSSSSNNNNSNGAIEASEAREAREVSVKA